MSNKTHEGKGMVVATMSGFGSQLCKGKMLAPLTSIVLDGTHLVSLCLNASLKSTRFSNY